MSKYTHARRAQMIPAITNTFGVPTQLGPLTFIIAVDGLFQALEDMAQADLAYLDMVLHKAGMHPTAGARRHSANRDSRNLKRGGTDLGNNSAARRPHRSDPRPATPFPGGQPTTATEQALAQSWQQLILLRLESQKLHLRLQVNTMSPQVIAAPRACRH